MTDRKKDQQEQAIRHLSALRKQAVAAGNYQKADAIGLAIQRAVKMRKPVRPVRDEQPAGRAR